VHVCTCACIRMYINASAYSYLCVYMRLYACVYECVCVCACVCSVSNHKCRLILLHAHRTSSKARCLSSRTSAAAHLVHQQTSRSTRHLTHEHVSTHQQRKLSAQAHRLSYHHHHDCCLHAQHYCCILSHAHELHDTARIRLGIVTKQAKT
jgi:hypothetical protein